MKKNKLSFIILLLVIVVLAFKYLNIRLERLLQDSSKNWAQHIDIPKEYTQFFNGRKLKVHNISTLKYNNSYPISFIKVNGMYVLITKFNVTNDIKTSFILDNNVAQTPRVWYDDYTLSDLDIYINNPNMPIKDILIVSNNSIDTLMYKDNSILFKGELDKLGIGFMDYIPKQNKLDKLKLLNIYVEDSRAFSNLRDEIKYYLMLKKGKGIVYLLLIETKQFDDKKVLTFLNNI